MSSEEVETTTDEFEEEEEEEEEKIKIKNPRKLVIVADGSICTPYKHTGFFAVFNCCIGFPAKREAPLFVNTIPQQLYDKLDITNDNIVKLYIPGCGSDGGATGYYNLMCGWEVNLIFMKIITFLANNYKENDEIYLFSYSRGSYAMSLVISFLQFFSEFNEGRCLPIGLKVWNNVTPKKLMYDLTKHRKDHLKKTFTQEQLRNNFKQFSLSNIRLLVLMDVVAMYTNLSMIWDKDIINYLTQLRQMNLPAQRTFKNIQRVVHLVPKKRVNYCIPCVDSFFELFPTSPIQKEVEEYTEKVNISQYFFENEDHLRINLNVDVITQINREVKASGLRLTEDLVSLNDDRERGWFRLFYCFLPLYLIKSKKPKDDYIVTKFEPSSVFSEDDEDESEEDEIEIRISDSEESGSTQTTSSEEEEEEESSD